MAYFAPCSRMARWAVLILVLLPAYARGQVAAESGAVVKPLPIKGSAHVLTPDHPIVGDAYRYGYELNLVQQELGSDTLHTLTVGSLFHGRMQPELGLERGFFSVWVRDLYWGFLGWAQAGDDSVLRVMRESIDLLLAVKAKNQAVGADKIQPLDDKRFYVPQAWVKGPVVAQTFMPFNSEAQAQTILLMRDYWKLTGDKATLTRWWPELQYLAETLRLLDTNGNELPDHVWGSYDYQGVAVGAEEPWLCATVHGAWLAAAEVAGIMGEKKLASEYSERAAALRASMIRDVANGGLWKPEGDGGYFINQRHTPPLAPGLDERFIPYENLGPIFFGVATPEQSKAIFRRLDAGFDTYYNLKYGPMYVGPAIGKEGQEFTFTSAPWLGFLDVYVRGREGWKPHRDRIFDLLIQHAYELPPACITEGIGIDGNLSGVAGRSWDNANYFHALLVGIYGMEKTHEGIVLRAPQPVAGYPLTLLENVRWRSAGYTLAWTGMGDTLREVRMDGRRLKARKDGSYLLTDTQGLHKVEVTLGGAVSADAEQPTSVPAPLAQPKILSCQSSKLHYLPGETIEWRALLEREKYPDTSGSKLLRAELLNSSGTLVTQSEQQFALHPTLSTTVLPGRFEMSTPLAPGKYLLRCTTTDQKSGVRFVAVHDFGVMAESDPFVCELPFKFLKDFSVIRAEDGRWHVFAIVGDLLGGHAWESDGQERTFAHLSSSDLRRWDVHPPVLSIHDKAFPDGVGRYQDHNVWAPHVIHANGQYFMFYTSVNALVAQSISLATSPDLFNWTDYPGNPVLTMEQAPWANWKRTQWADCRDPMVIEHAGDWYMFVTARALEGDPTGVAAVAKSKDLLHWETPKIVLRGQQPESIQVWKSKDKFYLTASTDVTGVSTHPYEGWRAQKLLRTPLPQAEKYVGTSAGFADEVVTLPDGRRVMASLTWRQWGNSLYFFEMHDGPDGAPQSYSSPFDLK